MKYRVRRPSIKQRISSRHGHLSNVQVGELLTEIAHQSHEIHVAIGRDLVGRAKDEAPVFPVVLKNGGYDPEVYSGFAAGLGPERISMQRYRIDDIRNFWGNDVRFLEQF